MEWIVVKTVLSLGAVIGMMFGLVFVMKKFFHGGPVGGNELVEIDVLASRTLQPKRSIYVIQVMNKVLVVGTTEEGMRTLGTIDDEQSLSEIREKQTVPSGSARWRAKGRETRGVSSFADLLGSQLGKIMWKGSR